MTIMSNQLPLSLDLPLYSTFADFVVGKNAQLCNELQKIGGGWGEQFIYLWGKHGVGKTHLLQATCHASLDVSQAAVYIPLKEHNLGTNWWHGLEKLQLVCIDDLQAIYQDVAQQEALLYAFNRLREKHVRLIVAATEPPKHKLKLLDLQSRLSWGVGYLVEPLLDTDKLTALQLRAAVCGLQLPETVGQYLLKRCARSMQDLFNTLEQLDRASIMQQRRLTIPFVRETLQL